VFTVRGFLKNGYVIVFHTITWILPRRSVGKAVAFSASLLGNILGER